MSNMDLHIVVKRLRITNIKKYWKCATQFEMELN